MSRPQPASPEVEAARAAIAEAARTIEGLVKGLRVHARRLQRLADSDPVASWASATFQDCILGSACEDSLVLVYKSLLREARPGEWERSARRFVREQEEQDRKEAERLAAH